jgi:hypothetical protein
MGEGQVQEMAGRMTEMGEAVEAAKEHREIARQVEQALKGQEGAEEKFLEATKQAALWRREGHISAVQEAELVAKAQKDLADSWKSAERPELAVRGSREEYQAIVRAQGDEQRRANRMEALAVRQAVGVEQAAAALLDLQALERNRRIADVGA